MKQVEEAGGAVAGAHMRMGDADDEILRHCEEHGDIGLLVMGSRGLGPIKRRLMGASPRASSATPTARSWWHAVRAVRVFGVASFLAKAPYNERQRIWWYLFPVLPKTLSEINLVEISLFAVFLGVFTLWSDPFEILLFGISL